MGISTAGFSAFFTVRSVSPASFSILPSVFLARSARIFSCVHGGGHGSLPLLREGSVVRTFFFGSAAGGRLRVADFAATGALRRGDRFRRGSGPCVSLLLAISAGASRPPSWRLRPGRRRQRGSRSRRRRASSPPSRAPAASSSGCVISPRFTKFGSASIEGLLDLVVGYRG